MTENSKIEWTDHTFNPWIGCSKVSDGCKNCYAEQMMDKRYGRVKWGPQGKRIRTSAANWKKPLKWNRDAKASGKRAKVFCASLADVFEDKPDQPEMDDWRRDLFEMIINTPHLDWLLLTKRPENVCHIIERITGFSDALMWFTDSVWIGTSVENQEQANKRIPELLKIPADIRFLSMEPLLGPVDIADAAGVTYWDDPSAGIHWVIVGGESGPNARPMHPDWARGIRNQCVNAVVKYFFKQWGEWWPADQGQWIPSPTVDPFTDDEFYKIGKKAAGRLLDGRTWDEFPLTPVIK